MNNDEKLLKKEILSSLLALSDGKITISDAEKIVSAIRIDMSNPYLMHKCPNWFAKDILSRLKPF